MNFGVMKISSQEDTGTMARRSVMFTSAHQYYTKSKLDEGGEKEEEEENKERKEIYWLIFI